MRITLKQWRALCAKLHGEQKYGEHPYRYHLEAVEAVAVRFGFTTKTTRMICHGHDLLEDVKGLEASRLRRAGASAIVVDAIYAVTDEPGATRKERKLKTYPKIAKNRRAKRVKLFDRIANLEESIKTGFLAKFDTYLKEHAEFECQLRDRSQTEIEPMWEHLSQLLQRRDQVLANQPKS